MECSRSPLYLESRQAEASAPRAWLFGECRQASSRCREFFKASAHRSTDASKLQGNYALKWKFHFMVRRLPARPSQLPDWYSSRVLAGSFLRRVNPLPPWRSTWWRYWPTAPLLVASQWVDTPLLHVSSRGWDLWPAMLCGSSEMLLHSLESFDLSSSWGSRLTSQELAFRMQALPTLALMLTAVACRIKAQNLSRGEGSNFAGLRSAWSSPLSVWAHSTGSVVSSQAPFRVVPPDGSSPITFIRILTWLLVPGSCPFKPAMDAIWFIFVFGISFPMRHSYAALSEPMKENVSGYLRNPCSLNREPDAAFAAKLLTLLIKAFSAEKSKEQIVRSPV